MSDTHELIVIQSASWLKPILRPGGLKAEVDKAVEILNQCPDFDAIAFTGLSGAVLASAVALRMDKLMYCVRKSGENRHSDYEVEGPLGKLRYVIIDDLIMSGATVRRIINQVRLHSDSMAKLVGIWLYRDGRLITSSNDLIHYTLK